LTLTKKHLAILITAVYLTSLLWLSSVWYNTYTGFHFFDDIFEWEYLDKFGHFFASFYLGLFFYEVFGDAESLDPPRQKKWFCFAGFVLLLPIEILDGFSMNYGASPADLLANGLGGLFCYWRASSTVISGLRPKFSFHATTLSIIRPDLLGANFSQQIIKDYNGQTYWLSLDVNKIFHTRVMPDWLMVTVGYGAEGMLGGHDNVWKTSAGEVKDFSSLARSKRILISVDLHVGFLRKKNLLFCYLLAPFVLIKFPAPAIEINFERGVIFHPIYF
jgi:hypothetical protein